MDERFKGAFDDWCSLVTVGANEQLGRLWGPERTSRFDEVCRRVGKNYCGSSSHAGDSGETEAGGVLLRR